MKKAILFLLLLSSCAAPAIPQETDVYVKPEDRKTYFVQVWTEKSGPDMMLLEGEDPGRLEVFEGTDVNNTIACAQFRAVKGWDGEQIANVSVGFVYHGDEKALHFKLFGGASRLTKYQTKISLKPEPTEGN